MFVTIMSAVVLLATVWCLALCAWLWTRSKKHLEPPTFPGSLPIIGHVHILAPFEPLRIWEIEQKLYQNSLDNGGIVKFYCGPVPLYTHIWKTHRSLLNPAFNQQVTNSFFDIFCHNAKKMICDLKSQEGTPFDIQPFLKRNVMASAFDIVFGVNSSDLTKMIDKYANITQNIFTIYFYRMMKVWLHLPIIYNMSGYKKQEDVLLSSLKEITEGIIKDFKNKLKDTSLYNNGNKGRYKSILEMMIALAEEKDAFTDDEIREHLDAIISAAYDTGFIAQTFIIILIGSHPEVQERVFKELQEVLGDENRDLTRHDLAKLVYLDAVMKESLRLYPPVPRIARVSNFTIKLRDYIIPAGSIFLISLYGMCRHPMWGPDANEFKPERWLDPTTLPTNLNAFAIFSLGRRNCIGKAYAMMSLKTNIAYLVQTFRITGEIHKVKSKCDLFTRPISGHHVTLELRK